MQCWMFISITQSSVSHGPSEITLICWIIISVETVVRLNIFWNLWCFFSLMNKKFKRNRNLLLQYKSFTITVYRIYHYLTYPCWIKVYICIIFLFLRNKTFTDSNLTFSIWNKSVLLTFYLSKNPEKVYRSPKILSSTTVSNIDYKSAYWNDV